MRMGTTGRRSHTSDVATPGLVCGSSTRRTTQASVFASGVPCSKRILPRLREDGPATAAAVRYTRAGFAGSAARRLPDLGGAEFERRAKEIATGPGRDDERAELLHALVDEAAHVATERLVQHALENLEDLFFLKTLDWETEHEYRVLAMRDEPGYVFVDFADTLVAVVVGDRFPGWQLPAAVAACREQGVELLRLQWPGGVPTPEPVEGAP